MRQSLLRVTSQDFRAVDVCVPELLTGGASPHPWPPLVLAQLGPLALTLSVQQAVGEQDDLRGKGNCNAAATQSADLEVPRTPIMKRIPLQ